MPERKSTNPNDNPRPGISLISIQHPFVGQQRRAECPNASVSPVVPVLKSLLVRGVYYFAHREFQSPSTVPDMRFAEEFSHFYRVCWLGWLKNQVIIICWKFQNKKQDFQFATLKFALNLTRTNSDRPNRPLHITTPPEKKKKGVRLLPAVFISFPTSVYPSLRSIFLSFPPLASWPTDESPWGLVMVPRVLVLL